MKKRTAMTLLVAGLVAGLALGSTALGFAATTTTAKAKASATASTTPPPGRPGPGGPGGRGPGGPGGPGGTLGVGMVDVVAKLTGETTTSVAAARQKGTSFAKIAAAEDVTVAQMLELATAAPKAALASEVSNGLITQAKSDEIATMLTKRLTEEVNATGTCGPPAGGAPGAAGAPPQGPPPAPGDAPTSSTGSTGSVSGTATGR